MNKSPDDFKMGIMEHLGELRTRIFSALIGILLTSLFAFISATEIFKFINKPLVNAFSGESLIGTGPAEAFIIKIKVSVFAGIVFALPWVVYQIWLFILPGLHKQEQKLVVPFVASATFLFLLGISFAYYLVMPLAFDFFINQYNSIGIEPTIRISENLNLMLKSLLAFGITFQMPVLSYFMAKLGVLTSVAMINSWRYVMVACVVVGAVLTPPDIFSQLLLSGPMVVLYVISIGIVKSVEKSSEA